MDGYNPCCFHYNALLSLFHAPDYDSFLYKDSENYNRTLYEVQSGVVQVCSLLIQDIIIKTSVPGPSKV